jgi:hypothetical protein
MIFSLLQNFFCISSDTRNIVSLFQPELHRWGRGVIIVGAGVDADEGMGPLWSPSLLPWLSCG